MKINDLATPGLLSNGIKLRIEAAKAIGSVEVTCMRTPGGKTTSAKTLSDFFTSCVSALSGLFDVTAPLIASATATATTTLKLAFTEAGSGMDTSVLPNKTCFVSSGNTVTGIAWGTAGDAGKIILTGTGFVADDTVVYTKPAANALRDRAGNQVATVTKTIV